MSLKLEGSILCYHFLVHYFGSLISIIQIHVRVTKWSKYNGMFLCFISNVFTSDQNWLKSEKICGLGFQNSMHLMMMIILGLLWIWSMWMIIRRKVISGQCYLCQNSFKVDLSTYLCINHFQFHNVLSLLLNQCLH